MEQKKELVNNKFGSGISLSLYYKLIGFLTKKGNKSKAISIVNNLFFLLSKRFNTLSFNLLYNLFFKLNIFVEVKSLRIKRRTYLVPFSIGLKRRSYLILKWLLLAVKQNKKKASISRKLYEEIELILTNKTCNTIKKKDLNNKTALLNRSNLHYRW